jgi:flagellar FliL protein
MASEKKAEATPAEAPKKKSKLLLIIVAAVVVVGGGVGAWLFLKPHKEEQPAEGGAAHAEEAKPKAVPQYYKFDPAFVVNFGGEGNSRYLQVTVEAMSRDPLVVEAIKGNEPAIRNDLVLLFSSQQYDVLMTAEGKDQLREQTLEAIRKTVASEGGKPETVENVYFTSFVIQ